MASLTLPGSPSDGDTVTFDGTKFTYDATAGRWTRELLSSRIETVVPSTNTSITATAISGNNLIFTQADGSTANVDLSSLSGGQVTTYATESDLPSDADNGSHGYVTATTFLYVKATSGWYKITSVNLTPSVTVSSNSHTFAAASETIDITYTVAEPEDTPVTVTISNTGISNTDQVNITHTEGNNTLTIVSGAFELSGGTITISASDGINIGTGTISIDCSYGVSYATFDTNIFGMGQTGLSNFNHFDNFNLSNTANYAIVGIRDGQPSGTYDFRGTLTFWQQQANNSWSRIALKTDVVAGSGQGFSNAANQTYQGGYDGNSWGQGRMVMNDDATFVAAVGTNGTLAQANTNQHNVQVFTRSGNTFTNHSSFNPYELVTDKGYHAQGGQTSINWKETTGKLARDLKGDNQLNRLVYWYPYRANPSVDYSVQGQIIVASRNGTTWSQEAALEPFGPDLPSGYLNLWYGGNDNPGRGETFYVNHDVSRITVGDVSLRSGSGGYTSGNGGVNLFTRSGTTWTEKQTLHIGDGDWYFGQQHTMSKDGNYLAVWVPRYAPTSQAAVNAPLSTARIYIYQWDSVNGQYDTSNPSIITPDGDGEALQTSTAQRWATMSMDFSGTRLAFAQPTADGTSVTDAGVVRLYKRSGSTWSFERIFKMDDYISSTMDTDRLELAADSSLLMVGYPKFRWGSNPELGRILAIKATS